MTPYNYSQKPKFATKGKIRVKLLIVLTIPVCMLFFAQLVFANSLATDGQKLAQIEAEVQKLEAENTTLRANIAKEASYANLQIKAQHLGFQKPSELITPN